MGRSTHLQRLAKREGLVPEAEARPTTTRRILEVAADLFATQGYGATSMEQVVTACGVGRDTVYRRFPSKLALFGSAIRQVREDTDKRFADFSISRRGNALERLHATMRWLYDVNLEPRLIAYRRIAFSEAAVVGKGLAQEPSPISDSLIELISEAQVDGLLLPADPAKILRLLFDAVISGPVMRAMSVTGDEANVALQEQEFQSNWAMLITGLEPR